MTPRLPLLAILLSVAGLLPFIGCGLAALGLDELYAQHMLWALMAYGAVVLSFVGGMHWGLALAPGAVEQGGRSERWRLLFGVMPSLLGWAALLAPLALPTWTGLCVLIAGFLATMIAEAQAGRRGLVPHHYIWLRWGLTLVVVAMLVTVLTLRLLGQHVVF